MSDRYVVGNNPHNEGNGSPPHDPHTPVANPPARAVGSVEVEAVPPTIAEGFIGEAVSGVAPTLDSTHLEQIARRVLASRGVNISELTIGQQLKKPSNLRRRPLRDVLEASTRFTPRISALRAGPAPESIIGGDERKRIFDTNQYPYSAIASLEITAHDNSQWLGTGWFVSPRVLVTAGHCVFIQAAENPIAGGWVQSIRVVPGRNGTGDGSEPFDSAVATTFRSVTGWVNDGSEEHDYGVLVLDTPLGAGTGAFSIGVYSDADLLNMDLSVAGYPADKGDPNRDPSTNVAELNTLWYDTKAINRVTDNKVFYDIDTYGGESGAPVFVADANGSLRTAVAIHAYGTSQGENSNSGTRINQEVYKTILDWKAQFS